MAKTIQDAIEQLEIYTTEKVKEWNKLRQKQDNSNEQYLTATAFWEAYRDIASKITELAELAEKTIDREKSDAIFTETLDLLDALNTRDGRFEYADYVTLHNNITALYDSFMDVDEQIEKTKPKWISVEEDK